MVPSSLVLDRVIELRAFWSIERGIIFQETEKMGDDFSLDLGNCAIDTQKMKSENSNLLTTQFNSKSVDLSIVWK